MQQILRQYFRSDVERDENSRLGLAVLFLKFLTDAAGVASSEKQEPRFHIPIQASFAELFKRRHDDNICDVMDIACYSLQELNKSTLDGIFTEFAFRKHSRNDADVVRWRHYVGDLIEWAGGFRFAVDAHRGAAPENAPRGEDAVTTLPLRKNVDSYTPPYLAEMIAELVSPGIDETIYDPACGFGNLLTAAWRKSGQRARGVFGQEIDHQVQSLARMNLIMNGIDHAQLAWGDSISEPRFIEDNRLSRFDVILSNLPFRLNRWGRDLAARDIFDRFWRGIPPKANGDWAFLSHVIESLADDGRAAVVVSNGVLFRGGVEGQIRRSVLSENLVDAVIALPSNLLPSAAIPCAILIFDKTRSKNKRADVLMVDATREFVPGRVRNSLARGNIERVVSWYRAFLKKSWTELPPDYCKRVGFDELSRFEYSLNIAKYLGSSAHESSIENLEDEIESTLAELEDVRDELRQYTDLLEARPAIVSHADR
jgi:type I restriction enzyme M protein